MRVYALLLVSALLLSSLTAAAGDGTFEGASPSEITPDNPAGAIINLTDDVYVITPFESVSISTGSTWQDNRHRAYWTDGIGNINGFLLFDVTNIPDNSLILNMTLRCYLENAFGSPSNNPVVDIYWSDDDNWTRTTAQPNGMSLNDLLINDVPFSNYVYSYDFDLDVLAHDWSVDLQDNRICLGFKNDVTYYSYVYFFGAYGSPVGPAPELTIETSAGVPQDVDITLTPINPPIQIPINGGDFDFTVDIANNDPQPATFHAWIMVTLPNGSSYGPVTNRTMNLGVGGAVNRTLTQSVPAAAPPGNYTYTANVGIYPGEIWDFDEFEFTKSDLTDSISPTYTGWNISGWESVNTSAITPQNSLLLSAYPNPFNPYTNLNFALNSAGYIDLSIFDITGRKVGCLAEGWHSGGTHEVRFNAQAISNGIYFARLTAGREISTCKLLFLK